jgi:hypothetical protein
MRPLPPDNQRLLTSYALTLFILGVTVGLLAILGRIAQEFQHRLVFDLGYFPGPSEAGRTPFPPLIDSLRDPGSRFVVFGFLVSLITMSCGGAIWFLGGQPAAPHARTWTRLGCGIAACLLISMVSTALVVHEDVRLAALIVPSALAMVLFMALVYLIVEQTLTGS